VDQTGSGNGKTDWTLIFMINADQAKPNQGFNQKPNRRDTSLHLTTGTPAAGFFA